MKKLIVGISFEGSVVLLPGQLEYFKEAGYETYLMAPESQRVKEFCEKEGCTHLPIVIEREISLFRDFKTLFQILRIFSKVKPDIVNLGTPKVSLLGMVAAFLLRVPNRIYTCRGYRFEHEKGTKRKILIGMEKITSYFAHEIICISPSVKDFGLQHGLFRDSKAIVINKGSSNGFDLKRFSRESVDKAALDALRSELNYNGKFVYCFVGRLVDRKGIKELFLAFKKLSRQYDNLELLFVGGIEQVQISDKSLISDMEKMPNITFAGPQKDVPMYISLSDVFVLPAWWEGFGNVLVQAAGMNVPVISTTGTGSRDAVSGGFNGILVPPKATDELYDAMELLYLNSEERNRMGNNGPVWAKHFENTIIWNGMNELYKKR